MTDLQLTSEIYTLNALNLSVDAFRDVCAVSIDVVQGGFSIRFAECITNPDVVWEFLNYALGLSAQEHLT